MNPFGSYRVPPPGVPYDWMVLRGLYHMSRPEPMEITIGLDGNGNEINAPFGVTLALAYGERLAEETL